MERRLRGKGCAALIEVQVARTHPLMMNNGAPRIFDRESRGSRPAGSRWLQWSVRWGNLVLCGIKASDRR